MSDPKSVQVTWTPRNTINVVICAVVVVGAAVLGGLAGAHVIEGAWIAPTQAALGGLLFGLLTPGSPVGRALDAVAGQGAPPAAAEIAAELTAPPTNPPAAPVRVRPSPTSGSAPLDALGVVLLIAGAALAWLRYLVPVLGLSLALHGCGAGALRQHATAAHAIHEAIDGAGVAIEAYTQSELAACSSAADRGACIDRVASVVRPAAAARDALIAPADVYRAEVDAACGIDAAHPSVPDSCPSVPDDVMSRVTLAARTIAEDWPSLSAALAALGAPAALAAIQIPR